MSHLRMQPTVYLDGVHVLGLALLALQAQHNLPRGLGLWVEG